MSKWLEKWKVAQVSPWVFIRDFASTWDEHEVGEKALSKPFPRKAYIRVVVRVWQECDVLFIEKSRQIMMTWIMAALYLWLSFKFAQRVFFQSKKEGDANAVVDRARHIYDELCKLNLPGIPTAKRTGQRTGTDDKIKFPNIKSEIWGIPQGPDIVRSYTLSGLLADEMNHQQQFEAGYTAAIPTVQNGAKYTAQGTANGRSAGWRMLYGISDKTGKPGGPNIVDSNKVKKKRFIPPEHLTEEEARYWIEEKILSLSDEEFYAIPLEELVAEMPGMRFWVTCDEGCSLRVHYSSDPEKDPKTKRGAAWVKREKARMKSETRWGREMEIEYDTFEGRPVISNWNPAVHIREHIADKRYPLRLSFDFGAYCGCWICQYVPIEGYNARQLRGIDEVILGGHGNTPDLGQQVVDKLMSEYPYFWETNSIISYGDPAGHQERETTSDKNWNSSIKILDSFGFNVISHRFGVPETTDLLETAFQLILPNGECAVVLSKKCEYFINCFKGGLHYAEKGRAGYYEKDGEFDHGGDMGRYMVGNCFDHLDLAQKTVQRKPTQQLVRSRSTGAIVGVRKSSRIESRGCHHV